MSRSVIKIAICLLFIGCVNAYGKSEYCSADRINQKIAGIWQGEDSYYFKFRINKAGKLCISILEDSSDTVRNIRDIVIINGKLKHLTYFTPLTRGYVVYANIEFKGEEMNFDWFGSYESKSGKASYHRREVSMFANIETSRTTISA
ncbi:MAG: hypothetical protein M3384_00215 [Acidobacteriota bacterium]|nr:hypothetical protein [Acidobacteriota bacterium]